MDLRHLRYFVAVVEELSFRRAAERLHISQPPLSRQIQALEDELGLRLLERDRRSRIALTDAGHTFLADARSALSTVAAAPQRAQEAARGLRGRLNLANIAAFSAGVLPRCLRAFREEFPQVEVFLVEMDHAEQLAALREGRIHLGIAPDLGTSLEHRFQSQPLLTCPMVAVLPAGYGFADESATEIGVEALANQILLCPSPEISPGYAQRLAQLCAATYFTPAAVHPVDGLENILAMVTAGYGVAILPEVLVGSPGHACLTKRLRSPVPLFQLRMFWLREASSQVLKNFLAVASRYVIEMDWKLEGKTSCRLTLRI
jgi:LysR family transcriptional regulator, benzoate and cis,cis-muconate-responsive activator of ben and cat genes